MSKRAMVGTVKVLTIRIIQDLCLIFYHMQNDSSKFAAIIGSSVGGSGESLHYNLND